MKQVCVIGAGSSGLPVCQVLHERGIAFDCYEAGSEVGGNWRYLNDNGMSSAYRSLHINTSRKLTEYRAYPMPAEYPAYPSHVQMARYFDDYVAHFGFRDSILFRTEVTRVEPAAGGGWNVTSLDRGTGEETVRHYETVIVANGHHWDPRYPEPVFPGAETFTGTQLHSHHYRVPDEYAGKRVLVVGFGNSASDIAVETSAISERTFLSTRRGGYVFPKFMFGHASDDLISPFLTMVLPREMQRWIMAGLLKVTTGKVTDFGLPKPDHKLFNAHPTVSESLLPRLGHGDITVKPNISRFDRGTVHFVDGSSEAIDAVVWCTGYKISFPFLDEGVIAPTDNDVSLFHRVVDPRHPGLFFVGLFQPLGATTVLAEAQSAWVADLLDGTAALPSPEEMYREIARYKKRLAKRYVASKRHTIQVDHYPYLAELRRARRDGVRYAKRSASAGAGARPASTSRIETVMSQTSESYRPEEASIRIDADPGLVWDLISDVRLMGQWSPECRRCIPLGGKRGVGARFIGVNRRGWVVWVTMNEVETSERGKSFGWLTRTNGVRWSYRLEADGDGTIITETWDVSGQSEGQRKRTASFANMALGGYEGHTEELRDGMFKTLERLKETAERLSQAQRAENAVAAAASQAG
ncbi:NAD(P)-binding domain-containing protein [Nonomuraea sp. NN258]|uniref:NAD(P)-binding domain-containing protein n=1 Tax=Nonomuraea antri TaxID=2730852 RepID=UPI00156A6D93|nr:NAD(P)-binding domain-containing protein [Nonomuraea antri]NRQ40081.1 NAD(P)-binding domain-containing protein [Nonomuraea antri]